ncbi:hypothetical protein TNCV_1515991 [Trichonephila clavipes]|nr:hypothetical protein TNCV_1515991 [Trichonephila clavipes]
MSIRDWRFFVESISEATKQKLRVVEGRSYCCISDKYGKFTEDCIPDGVFPIGDDVFVFASTYYDSVSVHIRRFKKYGKTYYPTPEGITLDPRWIEYIMRKKKVPESLEELQRPRLHGRKMPAIYRDESALYPFTRRPGKIPGRNAGPFFVPSFD